MPEFKIVISWIDNSHPAIVTSTYEAASLRDFAKTVVNTLADSDAMLAFYVGDAAFVFGTEYLRQHCIIKVVPAY